MESRLDLNLLVALDALLEERGVTGAARRLHTSAPAMSRTLARLRRELGDPVLVRAGRGMVPTPRALAMHAQVRTILDQAQALFVPSEVPDPATLRRSFAIQANDMLLGTLGAALTADIRATAPEVSLRFVPESREDTTALRDGAVDLELGRIQHAEPETRVEPLLSDPVVGVVRAGHPFARGPVELRAFADAEHVVTSRRGRSHGPVDELLAGHGLRRRVAVCAPTVPGSLFLLLDSDLVGLIPRGSAGGWVRALGLRTFEVPLELPPVEIGMAWHPRHEADGAHAWLRGRVRELAGTAR